MTEQEVQHKYKRGKFCIMVSKKKIFLIVSVVLIIILIGIFFLFFSDNNILNSKESFSVKTFLLKINIPSGGEYTSNIKIENNEHLQKEFNIYLNNLDSIASVNRKKITINPDGEEQISVNFKANLEIGVYPGELVISDGKMTKKIPVVITIEDNKKLFSIIYSEIPQYQNVYPGGKLGIDIKVYDMDYTKLSTINSNFYIENLDGEILWTNEEDLVIEGSKTNIVNIPDNWPKGYYVFVSSIYYQDVKSISAYVFDLSDEKDIPLQDFNTKFLIIISLGFIFAFIFLLIYLIKSRDEFLITLKKQQDAELTKNLKLIDYSKKKIIEAPKQTSTEKKKKISKLNKIKKKIINKLKKKQNIQKKELKKLKKHKKKSEIVDKLDSWKKEGYKMFEAEREILKAYKNADIKRQIGDWKKKGYRI